MVNHEKPTATVLAAAIIQSNQRETEIVSRPVFMSYIDIQYTNIKQALEQLQSHISRFATITDAKPENKYIVTTIDNGTRRYPMHYNLYIKLKLPV